MHIARDTMKSEYIAYNAALIAENEDNPQRSLQLTNRSATYKYL